MQIKIFLFLWLFLSNPGLGKYQEHIKIKDIFTNGIDEALSLETSLTKHQNHENYFEICFSTLLNRDISGCYIFPKDGEIENIKFISERTFKFKNNDYKVYKYLLDNENIADDEEMLFYSPELGIIMYKNLSWGGEGMIKKYSSDKQKTILAEYLVGKILSDTSFFVDWKE